MKVRIDDWGDQVTLVCVEGPANDVGCVIEDGFESTKEAYDYAFEKGWEVA